MRSLNPGRHPANPNEPAIMKPLELSQILSTLSKQLATGLSLVAVSALLIHNAPAAVLAVDLGGASDFAVLAGAGITVAGPVNSTVIRGDIGSFAVTSITGLENVVLNGVNHAGNGITQVAKLDLGVAYADAASRTPFVTFPPSRIWADSLSPPVFTPIRVPSSSPEHSHSMLAAIRMPSGSSRPAPR